MDLNIRKNNKYLKYMINEIKNDGFDYIIVSGHFGIAFKKYCEKNNIYKDKIVLVNGSLRKDKSITNRNNFNNKKIIFIDDSCYSKKTINKVKKYIKDNNGKYIKTFVFYDGSYEKSNDIISFYRYYDNYKVS